MTDDHKLKTEILADLAWEPSVTPDHIGVTVEAGVVTLSGHVTNYWQKTAAERAVGRVKEVDAIAEEIEVRLPSSTRHSYDEIAAAALHRFSWDASIPKDAVMVKVQKGFVTLTGEVDWHYQHDEAARAIRSLAGVSGVANQISVKHRPDTQKIQHDISDALHRSLWAYDHVEVSAEAGKVHLTVHVESWHDRNMAWSTAWHAAGATSIVNDIRVS